MTNPKYYYTYNFVDLETGEVVGWNSEVASTEDEAIDLAIARWFDDADVDITYKVDTQSFQRQTDEEMYALMNFTL